MCDNYQRDSAFLQYVGYSYNNNECLQNLFSTENVNEMSREITKHLRGVHPSGKDILVPNTRIYEVLTSVNENYRSNTGDIFTRYNLQRDVIDDYKYIRAQTIDIIVNTIRDELGIEANNKALTVWTSVLGEQNNHRMRAHDVIKIRKRRPAVMQFNMNY